MSRTMTVFRQTKLRALIEARGPICHYCSRQVKIRVLYSQYSADDATLDHRVPTSKGGTHDDDNLLLACRECNNAKGDRSYEDFLARPYRLKEGPAKPRKRGPRFIPRRVIEEQIERDKLLRWSMAAAIERGEVDDAGNYRKAPMRMAR